MKNRLDAADMKSALEEVISLNTAMIQSEAAGNSEGYQSRCRHAYYDAKALLVSEIEALDGATKETP